ncbi:MAG: hypothetical protein ACREM1_01105 [Longimicrobiales bacterium]
MACEPKAKPTMPVHGRSFGCYGHAPSESTNAQRHFASDYGTIEPMPDSSSACSTMRPRPRRVCISMWHGVMLGMLTAGCLHDPAPEILVRENPTTPRLAFQDAFIIVDTLHIVETPDGPSVWPRVRGDGRGGFLIADMRKGSIAQYSPSGALIRWKDTKADGLGVPDPAAVLPLPGGGFLVVSNGSGIGLVLDSIFGLSHRVSLPVRFTEDVAILSDSIAVVAGTGEYLRDPVLRTWNFRRDTVITSYFRPGELVAPELAAAIRWIAVEALSPDRLGAVYPAVDTIFYFNPNGHLVERVGLPFRDLRLPRSIPAAARRDPRARREWLTQIDLITTIAFGHDGTVVVPYQSFTLGGEPTSHLLVADRTGNGHLDIRSLPTLLHWDSENGHFYLELDRTTGTWLVATLRTMGE